MHLAELTRGHNVIYLKVLILGNRGPVLRGVYKREREQKPFEGSRHCGNR